MTENITIDIPPEVDPLFESTEEIEEEEEKFTVNTILIMWCLLFFQIVGSLIESKKITFGHEASYTILMGLFISYF